MGETTAIEYVHHTFNPWVGCSPVGAGCVNCFARRQTRRWLRYRGCWELGGPRVPTSDAYWNQLCRWSAAASADGQPRRVLVGTWCDVLEQNDRIPRRWRSALCANIRRLTNLDFLIVTKRPQNWRFLAGAEEDWPTNAWLIASASTQTETDMQTRALFDAPAAVRGLSLEPLLGPIDLTPYLPAEYWCFCGYVGDDTATDICLECGEDFPDPGANGNDVPCSCGSTEYDSTCPNCGRSESFGHWDTGPLERRPPRLDWIIAGGETGPAARPMHPDWVRRIRDDCHAAGVPFFFKQWGEWAPAGPIRHDPMFLNAAYYNDPRGGQTSIACATPRGNTHRLLDSHTVMINAGKRTAGRLLDGREHNEFPKGPLCHLPK